VEHLDHFGLSRDPFVKDPLPALHFESDAAVDAERRLLRGCLQRRGLCVLAGGVGLGKSTVLRRVLEQLDEERFQADLLVLVHGGVEGAWLMTRLAHLLGVAEPSCERPRLCGEIFDRLAALHEEGRHAVLLVDDAQLLARAEPLAELRGLLNLEHEGEHLLSVVLAGGLELERGVALDPALAQRVDVAVALAPLDAGGVSAFLLHRVRVAGAEASLFEEGALAEIARRSGGVPRLALTLADNALHEAWLLGTKRVGVEAVDRAVRDLGLALSSIGSPGFLAPGRSFAAPGESGILGTTRRDRTEPEIAPLFDGIELDATAILPGDGPPKDEDLETLLEEEVR
jgi:type II secretory pathway predicted ATPase ExeA